MKYGVLDIETTGHDPWSSRLLCIGWRDKAYTPFTPRWYEMLEELADPTIAKIVHTKYDHRWLTLAGFTVAGPVIDTQVMAWAVNERMDLDLESLAQHYCGITMDKRISTRAGKPVFQCDNGDVVPLETAPIKEVLAYNERDLVATERLFLELRRILAFEDMAGYWEHDAMPFTRTLVNMETRGIPVDVERSKQLRETLENEMERLHDMLHVQANLPEDFNLGSSKQLSDFLYKREFTLPAKVRITPEERADLKAEVAAWGTVERNGVTIDRVGNTLAHGVYKLRGRGLPVHEHTENGAPKTDAKTLRVHYGDDPWVSDLLELSSRRTIVNTFLANFETMAHRGRIYGRFNQTGTKTGRLSSSSPNLQNIPSRGPLGRVVRELFRPVPGTFFVHGDYGQLEPRLMAHFSGDPVLSSIYLEGKDIYLETAERVFGRTFDASSPERRVMKTYVLALGYGSGAKTLRRSLAEAGFFFPQHEVDDTLDALKRVYRVLFDWKESVISDAENEGYVETLSGHRRHFGGQRNRGPRSWREVGQDERQAVNAVIQGSAADIVARSMMTIERDLPDLRLLVQVHDELLMEAGTDGLSEPVEALLGSVQRICERGHGFELSVPLEFVPKVVPSWAEGKD